MTPTRAPDRRASAACTGAWSDRGPVTRRQLGRGRVVTGDQSGQDLADLGLVGIAIDEAYVAAQPRQRVAEEVRAAQRVQPESISDRSGLAERPGHQRSVQRPVELQRRGGVGERRADVDHHVVVVVEVRPGLVDVAGCHDQVGGPDDVCPELGQQLPGCVGTLACGVDDERRPRGRDDDDPRASLRRGHDRLAICSSTIAASFCRRPTADVASSCSTSAAPMQLAHTARPARNPLAPALIAVATADGKQVLGHARAEDDPRTVDGAGDLGATAADLLHITLPLQRHFGLVEVCPQSPKFVGCGQDASLGVGRSAVGTAAGDWLDDRDQIVDPAQVDELLDHLDPLCGRLRPPATGRGV